jgi:hypothetical protein
VSDRPFVDDLRDSLGTWLPAALATGATAWVLAAMWDAQGQLHAVFFLVIGLAVLPLAITVALASATLAATLLLALLATPAHLLGRPTGFGSLLHELWRLPTQVLPGYWAALRRVRRPVLWGVLLGFAAGTTLFVMGNGLRPPLLPASPLR